MKVGNVTNRPDKRQ